MILSYFVCERRGRLGVCVCVCVCERERERSGEGGIERERIRNEKVGGRYLE